MRNVFIFSLLLLVAISVSSLVTHDGKFLLVISGGIGFLSLLLSAIFISGFNSGYNTSDLKPPEAEKYNSERMNLSLYAFVFGFPHFVAAIIVYMILYI